MRKLIAGLLSMAMLLCMSAVTMAAGNAGTSTVVLDVDTPILDVTVPVSLPVHIAADGTVTCSTNASIVNNSHGKINVESVTMAAEAGWTLVPINTDFSATPVGTKNLWLSIDGKECNDVTSVWGKNIAAANAGDTDVRVINYTANMPAQSEAITSTTVASVVFTVGWATT